MEVCLRMVLTAFITIFCAIRETFEGPGGGTCAVWGQTDELSQSGSPLYTMYVACEFGGNVIDVLL